MVVTGTRNDAIDDRTLAETGRLIWEGRVHNPYVVGSQGVEYALVAHRHAVGLANDTLRFPAASGIAGKVASAGRTPVVVSGSASAVTAAQIAWAEANGFGAIPFEAAALGTILDRTLRATGVRRAINSGGDTSGAASRLLGIHALCRAHPAYAGLQVALKGGQMGSPNCFGWILDGGGDAPR